MSDPTKTPPLRVGIIGTGNISGAYLQHATRFDDMRIVACANRSPAPAEAQAKTYGVQAMSVETLLADPSIDMVLNLTVPQAHTEINRAALAAGKHVYVEKPLALDPVKAADLLAEAERLGLRVGCAPDTFLGAGQQTCRHLLDDGRIGDPVAATAFMMCPGHEHWHPNPGFYYLAGGGPILDMGPYYLTALVNLFGGVVEVMAMARRSGERVATCGACRGARLPVEVDTHTAGLLRFENGVVATLVMSFDVQAHRHAPIEVYGTRATLGVPDPNTFGGPVLLHTGDGAFVEEPLTHGYAENSRSLGVAEMAHAIRTGRAHRASGALAAHVLEVMDALRRSASGKACIRIESRCGRPEPMPTGLRDGAVG